MTSAEIRAALCGIYARWDHGHDGLTVDCVLCAAERAEVAALIAVTAATRPRRAAAPFAPYQPNQQARSTT